VAAFLDDSFIEPYAAAVQEAWQRERLLLPWSEAPGPANTSHLSVIDGEGMAVALTTTAGESAGLRRTREQG
jgi:gamma-glutamyltranspeptidase